MQSSNAGEVSAVAVGADRERRLGLEGVFRDVLSRVVDGDRVPYARCRSVGQGDFRAGLQCAVKDEVGASADVEGGDVLAGFGDQHRQQPCRRSWRQAV